MSYKSRGFTLIELLVVISIIALLIGLLLPALAGAKASANNLVCQTNVRSLITAETAYTNDFQGAFSVGDPNAKRCWAPGGDPTLDPDENSNADTYGTMNFAQGTLFEYMSRETEAYKCPVGSQELEASGGGILQRSYSKNAYVSGGTRPNPQFLRQKITRVMQPSGMFVFGEENGEMEGLGDLTAEQEILVQGHTYNDSWMIVKHPTSTGWDDSIGTYHSSDRIQGTTNVSFVDGHVGAENPIYTFYQHNQKTTYNVQRITFDEIPTDAWGPTGKIRATR